MDIELMKAVVVKADEMLKDVKVGNEFLAGHQAATKAGYEYDSEEFNLFASYYVGNLPSCICVNDDTNLITEII